MTPVTDDVLSPEIEAALPYEQQAGESATHFAWFHAYLTMGPSRSLRGAYKIFYSKSPKVSKGRQISPSWREASNKWNWVGRAGAWDKVRREERERLYSEREGQTIDKVFERIGQQLERASHLDKFADFVLKYPTTQRTTIDGQTVIEPAKWNFATGIRAFIAGSEANKTVLEILQLLGEMERGRAMREMLSDNERQIMEAKIMLEGLGYKVGEPVEGVSTTPTELRAVENQRLDMLEMILAQQVKNGQPGAVERMVRLAQRRARLNGLDKPFDRAAEIVPKRRRDMSKFSKAELDILEEMFSDEEE